MTKGGRQKEWEILSKRKFNYLKKNGQMKQFLNLGNETKSNKVRFTSLILCKMYPALMLNDFFCRKVDVLAWMK